MLLILFIALLLPIIYLYRYKLITIVADFILITLHIFGLVPDPRYKTSHSIGIFTELDLIHFFEDVAQPHQIAVLEEYRRTLRKFTHLNDHMGDERVSFTRDFEIKNNIYPLPIENGTKYHGSISSSNMSADYILSQKQQRVANEAISAATIGITIGATYAASAASKIYQFASEKYIEYQNQNNLSHNNDQNDGKISQECIIDTDNVEDDTLVDSAGSLGTPTSFTPPLSHTPLKKPIHPQNSQNNHQNSPHISNHNTPSQLLSPMKQSLLSTSTPDITTILEDDLDNTTDTFVDGLQRSFSTFFQTKLSTRKSTRLPVRSSRFSIQNSTSIGNSMGDDENFGQNDGKSEKKYEKDEFSSSKFLNSSTVETTGSLSSTLTQSENSLRQRLQRLSNQPEVGGENYEQKLQLSNNSQNYNQNNNTPPQQQNNFPNDISISPSIYDYGDNGLHISQPDTTLLLSQQQQQQQQQQPKTQRTSYLEKYKKNEKDREIEMEKKTVEKITEISTTIDHNKNIKKLEYKLSALISSPSLSSPSLSSPSPSSLSPTISYTHYINTINKLSLYQALSNQGQLSMSFSTKYKSMLSPETHDYSVNIPLLVFQFVDFNTINLALLQFGYVDNGGNDNNNGQPVVMLEDGKRHPSFNLFVSSDQNNDQNNEHTDKNNKNNQKNNKITPFLSLSSTLTSFSIHDMLFLLNNYQFDPGFQLGFTLQQNAQIQHQKLSSQDLYKNNPKIINEHKNKNHNSNNNNNNNEAMLTIPTLFEPLEKTLKHSPDFAQISQSKLSQLLSSQGGRRDYSASLLLLSQLTHVIPGRRRSLYNVSSTDVDIQARQGVISSLHHSLFFSVVVDTDIYDFICISSQQRDVIVRDLQLAMACVQQQQGDSEIEISHNLSQNSPNNDVSVSKSATSMAENSNVNDETSGTMRGGYNLRSRVKK